jgi:hypothetical protein
MKKLCDIWDSVIYFIMSSFNWITVSWWKYLLAPKSWDESWLTVISCRVKGHPCGVRWVNPGGLEPDMTCKICGDDLG